MSTHLVIVSRNEPPEAPVYDVSELAAMAVDRLEEFRRAPWTGMNDEQQGARLQQAIEIIQRVQDIRSGKIPIPAWGD